MSMKDFHNEFKMNIAKAVNTITDNTAGVSEIIDAKGFSSQEWLVYVGTLSDADTVVTVQLYEGDASDMSDESAVASGDIIGVSAPTFEFDDDGEAIKFGYRGTKRYTRCKFTPANNTGNIPYGMLCLQGHPDAKPETTNASEP